MTRLPRHECETYTVNVLLYSEVFWDITPRVVDYRTVSGTLETDSQSSG